jgi:eukaryotic-like serine/threonine-protein kinase
MSSEKWNRINELFYAALDLPPEERNTFLKESCGSDSSLQEEVESLLAAYSDSADFIQTPAIKNAHDFLHHQEIRLETGAGIGAYKIVREIGRGGMGAVYLGVRADDRFQKSVAIKIIKRGMDTDDVLRHFRNEQQILGNLDHPNIARLIDAGSTESGLPYFIMEFVEGEPIDQYCNHQSLSISERLKMFEQVCGAISYAHRNLVVHRDIKPSNILVTSDGVPKLLDFGIAKILLTDSGEKSTATGIQFMTPEYASPEQAQGHQVTTLTDVYSLGVLLYELLTGQFPYPLKNRSALEILRTITETQPQLPSAIIDDSKQRRRLRGDLDNIVLMTLRKEPPRRYQSVDQLSEDIRRHLQGLPIAAHKDTITYRASRFILRNRVAVAIVVAALVTLAAFAGIMQSRANKQAKLFQEFGQEVTRIESFMRYAYLLPQHNIERDKKRVKDRLDYIKKKMDSMGTSSYGAGYYSLGRGFLSLHRYQDAYNNLILAWQKYQYQEPAAANALGLALAMLYQEKILEAEQLYSREQLNQRKSEFEKLYLSPAVQYIKKGENVSESPQYVQAILHFLQKQYPQALNQANAAEQDVPWNYESKKLQGDIFTAMGNEQSELGKITKGFELYGKANTSYLEAAKKGESDPQIYEALCYLQARIQELRIDQRTKLSEEDIENAVSYCKSALRLDAGSINANLTASRLYKDWAFYQSDHGNDPSIAAEKAMNFAKAALKIDSESAVAHIALGEAYSTRSDWELLRGRDPIPYLDLAEASYTKAIQKIPKDYVLLSLVAQQSMKRAMHYINTGKDPRPALEKSIEHTQHAIQLTTQKFRFLATLGHAYHVKGQYEYDVGLDPRESLNKSIQYFKQSISINHTYLFSYIWCGNSYMTLADYYISVEQDPNQVLNEAIKIFKEALTIDPENFWAHSGAGIALSRKGLVLQKAGKDPTSELKMSREAFKKALQVETSAVSIYSYAADAELIGARDAISRKKSPEPFFIESEQAVKACLKANPDADDCLGSLAEIHSLRAEYLLSLGKSPEQEISTGLKHADHALKANADNALAMVRRAKLFLIRAQFSSGVSRKQDAQAAMDSFNQAFKTKLSLRKQYEKDLAQAQQLSES